MKGTQESKFHDDLTAAAKDGDIEAARRILGWVATSVEEIRKLKNPEGEWSGPIPWAFADYLASAFRETLVSPKPDANKSLNLIGRTKGRRKGGTTHNAMALAAAFYFLRRRKLTVEVTNAVCGFKSAAASPGKVHLTFCNL